jgi:hypothetical protein
MIVAFLILTRRIVASVPFSQPPAAARKITMLRYCNRERTRHTSGVEDHALKYY